jgi:hypothetical protein
MDIQPYLIRSGPRMLRFTSKFPFNKVETPKFKSGMIKVRYILTVAFPKRL